jgi:hypothetical protein
MKRGQKLKLIERADQKEGIAKIIEKEWTRYKTNMCIMVQNLWRKWGWNGESDYGFTGWPKSG